MSDTRQKLIDGALETIRTRGIAGVSARSIATAAGVNQALVFYHFGSVDDLLGQACLAGTEARVAQYRDRFAAVDSLAELLELGRAMHAEERRLGNVTVLAQLLAGAQADPKLAEVTATGLRLWTVEIELALTRLLAGSPLAGIVDPGGLAKAISAGFIGLELFEAVDRDGVDAGLAALEQLAALVTVVENLGPVARRAFRAKLRSGRQLRVDDSRSSTYD